MLALGGCQDSTRPGPGDVDPSAISVAYVCGSRLDLSNGHEGAVTGGFEVGVDGERGELTLPARLEAGTPSVTRLSTQSPGRLRVVRGRRAIGEAENAANPCPPPMATAPEPIASQGEWSAPISWPVVAVHLHVLPDGRVLSWGRIGDPQIWDPATGTFTAVPSPTHVFCAGHTFLADGRLLVAGGHISDDHGLPDANVFDAASARWSRVATMAHGRWYPTATTLAGGRVLALAGEDENGQNVAEPEVWNGDA